jgi:hypothetical protein
MAFCLLDTSNDFLLWAIILLRLEPSGGRDHIARLDGTWGQKYMTLHHVTKHTRDPLHWNAQQKQARGFRHWHEI